MFLSTRLAQNASAVRCHVVAVFSAAEVVVVARLPRALAVLVRMGGVHAETSAP